MGNHEQADKEKGQQEYLASLTDDRKEQLINAAARISGEPPEEITLEKAADIYSTKNAIRTMMAAKLLDSLKNGEGEIPDITSSIKDMFYQSSLISRCVPERIINLAPYIIQEIEAETGRETTTPELADLFIYGFNDDGETTITNLRYKRIIDAAELKKITETIRQGNLKPKQHVTAGTTLMDAIIGRGGQIINGGVKTDILVFDKPETYINIVMGYRNSGAVNPTPYEACIINAAFTIFVAANELNIFPPCFTVETIYQAMPGCGSKPSETEKKIIIDAIRAYAFMPIALNFYNEMQARAKRERPENRKAEDSFYLRGYFLPVQEIGYRTRSGQEHPAWYFLTTPIVLEHAMLTGHDFKTPMKYLKILEVDADGRPNEYKPLPTSKRERTIIEYLNDRIRIMEYDRKQAHRKFSLYKHTQKKNNKPIEKNYDDFLQPNYNIILFQTLLKEIRESTEDRKILQRIKDFCIDVFRYWVAIKRIQGYKLNKKKKANGQEGKREINSFTIIFNS